MPARNAQKWNDSKYRFSDPVRYFKANDPYYWEVDNIPIKQLQENDMWLKDQVGQVQQQFGSVGRRDITELLPYVNGEDNILRVSGGRYTARVNSVPLTGNVTQELLNLWPTSKGPIGGDVGQSDRWSVKTYYSDNASTMKNVLDRFKVYSVGNITEMNGLAERAFTYPAFDSDDAMRDYIGSYPTIKHDDERKLDPVGMSRPPFPVAEVYLWAITSAKTPSNKLDFPGYTFPSDAKSDKGFSMMAITENAWIRAWGGVFRTAVVDVPSELTIEETPFVEDDIYYLNDDGRNNSPIGEASHRIDLLFIYSKPVDMSGVTLAKYTNDTANTITKPQLGILKGAGIGIDFTTSNPAHEDPELLEPIGGIDDDGRSLMLANPSDQLEIEGVDRGFVSGVYQSVDIRGSFPAPDDLLNISPLLSEKLSSDEYALIGQSILPLAYVVVERGNNEILLEKNIIDIRPFLRTTELAYNERAGVGAAMPQLSFANPAVGKAQMDHELGRVHGTLKTLINTTVQSSQDQHPRVVGIGTIFGGGYWGPEACLMNFQKVHGGGSWSDTNDLKTKVRNSTNFGINGPAGNSLISDKPDWDLFVDPYVSTNKTYRSKAGTYMNDWIHTTYANYGSGHALAGQLKHYADRGNLQQYGFSQGQSYTGKRIYVMEHYGETLGGSDTQNNWLVYFVKKTIKIDRTSVAKWMGDYNVDVSFHNCIPISTNQGASDVHRPGTDSSIWVDKKTDEFTIFVSIPCVHERYRAYQHIDSSRQDHFNRSSPLDTSRKKSSNPNNRGGWWPQIARHAQSRAYGTTGGGSAWSISEPPGNFATFMVLTHDMMQKKHKGAEATGSSTNGVCLYPTVQYKVTGIPKGKTTLGIGKNKLVLS